MSFARKTCWALAMALLALVGVFLAVPSPDPVSEEMIVTRTPLSATGSTGISDEDAAEARRAVQRAQHLLREANDSPTDGLDVDPASYGYDSLEAMEFSVREQFGVPDEFDVVLVHEVRDGRDGLGIGIAPRGT